MIYSGSDINGAKVLKDALAKDPDCIEAVQALKMIKVSASHKEEASALFKAEQLDEAILKFD